MYTKKTLVTLTIICSLSLLISASSTAQEPKKHKHRTGSLYFSWGYNADNYTKSTLNVDQKSLGNDYNMIHVTANDHKGWDENVLHKQLSIPQYNWRWGYYFNKKQDLAFELNFDHTKYLISDPQNIHLKGTLNHRAVDTTILFSQSTGFFYYLNNGANFLCFNIVKKLPLYHTKDKNLQVDLTGKAGIGPVVPHVQNEFFFMPNQQHFQLGGWNTGLETALRVTIMRYGFLEFSQKVDYARYSGLKIADGLAKQNFGTYELILSAGVIVPMTRHNPMFYSRRTKPKDDNSEE